MFSCNQFANVGQEECFKWVPSFGTFLKKKKKTFCLLRKKVQAYVSYTPKTTQRVQGRMIEKLSGVLK